MSYITRNLKQKVTHWRPVPDGYGGSTFTGPFKLLGRWEQMSERFVDAQGEEVVSKAVVYLSGDVASGDWIYLGTSVLSDPSSLQGAEVIRSFSKIPDIHGVLFERKAML